MLIYWQNFFAVRLLQESPTNSYMLSCESWRYVSFLISPSRKMRFASVIRLVYLLAAGPTGRTAAIAGSGQACHLNLTHCGDTKSSMRRDGSGIRTSL